MSFEDCKIGIYKISRKAMGSGKISPAEIKEMRRIYRSYGKLMAIYYIRLVWRKIANIKSCSDRETEYARAREMVRMFAE